jgi:hypothetical protein
MTDERRRRDEQRLHRAQEIAHALRERQAELQLEIARAIAWPAPDDVC